MPLRHRSSLATALLVPLLGCAARTPAATAPTPADAPIMAAVDSVLLAINTGDASLMRRMLLPGASFYGMQLPGAERPFAVADTATLARFGRDRTPNLERYWSPRLERHGRLAIVTAPYDFWRDRKFSHCGVDVFTVVEQGGQWRIASIAYTIQRVGCAASPLGTPVL
jgi:hypothetical protein